MKKKIQKLRDKKKLLVCFCLSCCFSSCSVSIIEDEQSHFAEQNTEKDSEENVVTYNNILTLTRNQNISTRSSSQNTSKIECLTNTSNDTLLYVNKTNGGGWTMYSSDTRVPAIVAQSESGSFDDLLQIEAAQLWIRSIIEDMALIRSLSDDELNFSQKEIAENKKFWKSISSPDKFVRENLTSETRAVNNNLVLTTGHYEFRYSASYTEVYDSVPRMTSTIWDQGSPYNYYCPLKSDNSGHAPAGCVAIAGAQMLYFLHNYYGVPATAPSEAYCTGNINSYTGSQYNYTTTIWDYMNYNGLYAAPLIADVGRRLNMDYGNNGSGAYTSDLVDNVFAQYGISCTYADYNVGLLKNSLISGMPVILSARSTYSTNTGTEKVGHAFIADRYKRTRTVTKNYYEWVYDSYPSNTPIPMMPEKIEYTYTSPSINMIGMNWGWGNYYYVPCEWYSLTGDWISSRYSMSAYNWNIDRHMIYGFQILNNN